MKQWIEHHKKILQTAASALLALSLVLAWLFMIHPVKSFAQRSLVEFVSNARK